MLTQAKAPCRQCLHPNEKGLCACGRGLAFERFLADSHNTHAAFRSFGIKYEPIGFSSSPEVTDCIDA